MKGKRLRQPGPGLCALHKAGALSGFPRLPQLDGPSLRAVLGRAEGTCVCLPVPGTSPAPGSLKHTPDAAELLQSWCGPSSWHGTQSNPLGSFDSRNQDFSLPGPFPCLRGLTAHEASPVLNAVSHATQHRTVLCEGSKYLCFLRFLCFTAVLHNHDEE